MKILISNDNKPLARTREDGKFPRKQKGKKTIECDATRHEAAYIVKHCDYRNDEFYLRHTNIPFSQIKKDVVNINRNNYTKANSKDNEKFLCDTLLNINESRDLHIIRKKYFEETLPLIKIAGFDRLASAILYGCFADIERAVEELPTESKKIFREHDLYSNELKELLTNIWNVL